MSKPDAVSVVRHRATGLFMSLDRSGRDEWLSEESGAHHFATRREAVTRGKALGLGSANGYEIVPATNQEATKGW